MAINVNAAFTSTKNFMRYSVKEAMRKPLRVIVGGTAGLISIYSFGQGTIKTIHETPDHPLVTIPERYMSNLGNAFGNNARIVFDGAKAGWDRNADVTAVEVPPLDLGK